jgi:hypothetical protein
MSTDDLRRELDRIADSAPVASVPADTYRRARHSVVRDRAVSLAATAAVVGIVAAGATWLPHRIQPPVAKTSTEAIPARLWSPRYDVPLPPAGSAPGPVSAVFRANSAAGGYRVVAVLAETGAYHELHLPDATAVAPPGTLDTLDPGEMFQLSPDGRQLAYATLDQDDTVGVAVKDLVSGSVRRVPARPVDGGPGDKVWSSDGRYLVWRGQLLGPGATTATALPVVPDATKSTWIYAVDDDGTVTLLDRDSIATWRDGRVVSDIAVPTELTETWPETAQVVDGEVVDLRMILNSVPNGPLHLLARHGTDPTWAPVRRWSGAEPLGWDADGRFLAAIMMGHEGEFAVHRYTLTDGAVTEEPAIELPYYLDHLTLATHLPIADRPAPEWADEGFLREHTTLLVGLSGTGVLALLWGVRRLRRRRAATR